MMKFLLMNMVLIRKVVGIASIGALLFGLLTLNVAAATVGAIVLIVLNRTKP